MAVPNKFKTLLVALWIVLFLGDASHAQNGVLGEVRFVGPSKVEKTSGVWIDGQYVGYLKELKGDKKVLLLPGDHDISVRGQRLHVPALALGVDGVESQRGLARTAEASNHSQRATGDFHTDV